jgi:hypothetical protein
VNVSVLLWQESPISACGEIKADYCDDEINATKKSSRHGQRSLNIVLSKPRVNKYVEPTEGDADQGEANLVKRGIQKPCATS